MIFKYSMPSGIFFGRGCVKTESSVLAGLGKKALVVTGKKSAKINGSQKDVFKALEKQNIDYFLYDMVENNPSVETVRQGAELARKENAQFIIAAGGGSPLDAGKAIAALKNNDVNDDVLFSGELVNPVLPVVAIPTTAGTGSEVTQYSILTDRKNDNKKNLSMPSLFPRYAFLDPFYTESLSKKVTIDTAVDALSHGVESYLSKRSTVMSKLYAAESLRVIGGCLLKIAGDNEIDYSLREELLYGSMLGGFSIAQTGTTILHAMGYPLTYFKDIPHGMANGLLMNSYMKYEYEGQRENTVKVFEAIGVSGLDEFTELIDSLLGTEIILTDEEMEKFALIAGKAASVGNTVPLPDGKDILRMYRSGTK